MTKGSFLITESVLAVYDFRELQALRERASPQRSSARDFSTRDIATSSFIPRENVICSSFCAAVVVLSPSSICSYKCAHVSAKSLLLNNQSKLSTTLLNIYRKMDL